MSSLLTPTGPESPRTYWMRRAIVLITALVILGLIGWAVVSAFSSSTKAGNPPPNKDEPAPTTPVSSAPATTPAPKPTPTPSASAKPSTSSAKPSPTASTTTAKPTPTPTPTPTTPAACDPAAVQLAMDGQKYVKNTAATTFTVSLTNPGANTCVLDLAKNPISMAITSGSDKIWSTAHCPAAAPKGTPTLAPKKATNVSIAWPTKRSEEGCKLSNEVLGAGYYVATTNLAGGGSARFVYQLTK